MLPLFLFAAGMATYEVGVTHRQEEEQAAILAENLALATDKSLNSRINALNILAMSPLVDDLSRWDELYREAQGFYQSFGTHVVISDGGTPTKLRLNTRVPFGTKLPVVEKGNGRLAGPIAMRTRRPAVSDLFAGPVANEPLVGIAVPVLREGKAKYAIITTLDRDFFQKRMDKIALPSGWSMTLKDAEGAIIASRPQSPIKDPATRFVAKSQISRWTATVEIPRGAHWWPLVSAAVALGGTLLGVTLAGFLGGKWAGRRLGRSVASLAETPAPGAPPPDILEIAAVRRLLDEALERRARAEATLRENEERFRLLFEEHGASMLLIEPHTGAIADANNAAVAFYGYSREQLRSMRIDQINQLSSKEVEAERQKAVHHKKDRFIFPHRLADGQVKWVEVFSSPVKIQGGPMLFSIIHDITERKRAEDALADSERKYRELIQTANSIIIRWDKDGVIRFVNDYGLRFFGYSEEELIGKDVMIIVPHVEESTGRDLDSLVREIVKHPAQHTSVPNENVRKDGRTVWVAWTNKAMLDEEGKVREILAIGNDITALKEAEEQLRTSLGEKEVLLKEIHHRVKNNMQVISSLVALQANEIEDGVMSSALQDVTHRVRSMAMVHEKLYQSADLSRVEFDQYVRSLLSYLWRAHGTEASSIRLALDLDPVSLSVNEAVPCGLILNELVTNALKHAFHDNGAAEGVVTVSLHADENGEVRLSVRDNGKGLPRGFELDEARSLGLRLVKMLSVQLHAVVEISGGEGTEVKIAFKEPKA